MAEKFYLITALMIFLIATLPAVSAINIRSFSGKDKIEGFVKEDDKLKIELESEEPITKTQTRIYDESSSRYENFNECKTEQSGTTICTYEEEDPSPAKYNIKVTTKDTSTKENPQYIYEASKTLKQDLLDPEVKSIELRVDGKIVEVIDGKKTVGSGKADITVTAHDYATKTTGIDEDCVGIKTIAITVDGQKKLEEIFDKTICSITKATTYEIPKNKKGVARVCATVKDKFLRQTQKCEELTIDNEAPNIKTAEVFKQGKKVNFVKPSQRENVEIVVAIEGKDIDENSVMAKLSDINPEEANYRGYDFKNENNFFWRTQFKTKTCSLNVKAKDKFGNEIEKKISCDAKTDTTSPVLTAVSGDSGESAELIISSKGKINAVIEDKADDGNEGVGVKEEKIFLNMELIGVQPDYEVMNLNLKKVPAQKCEKKQSSWKCTWSYKETKKEIQSSTIQITGSDILDNELQIPQTLSLKASIDVEKPQILSIQRTTISGQEIVPLLTQGQTTKFAVLASPDTKTMNAELNSIGGGVREMDCSPAKDTDKKVQELLKLSGSKTSLKTFTLCNTIATVATPGYYNYSIKFEGKDFAGNKAEGYYKGEVFKTTLEEEPNYWSIETTCSPDIINRNLAQTISTKVYCQAKLVKSNNELKDIEPASIQISKDGCRGDLEGTLASKPELTNNQAGSTSPFIELTLETKEFSGDSKNIECDLKILTATKTYTKEGKLERTLNTKPETRLANLTIYFAGESLGTVYEHTEKQIKDAIKTAEKGKEFMELFGKIVAFAEKICKIKSLIATVIGVFNIITTTLNFAELSAERAADAAAIPTLGFSKVGIKTVTGPMYLARMTACGTREKISIAYTTIDFGFLNQFCSWVHCTTPSYCSNIEKLSEKIPSLGGAIKEGRKIIEETEGGKPQQDVSGVKLLDVKNSIVWSTLCMCIPGIYHNLEKIQEINCRYANCLIEDVKQSGLSASTCKDDRSFMKCAFVVGQIWSLFPFTNFIDQIIDLILALITDPVQVVGLAVGLYCLHHCAELPETFVATDALCGAVKTVAILSDAVASVKGIAETKGAFFEPEGRQECGKLDKLVNEMKTEQEEE